MARKGFETLGALTEPQIALAHCILESNWLKLIVRLSRVGISKLCFANRGMTESSRRTRRTSGVSRRQERHFAGRDMKVSICRHTLGEDNYTHPVQ